MTLNSKCTLPLEYLQSKVKKPSKISVFLGDQILKQGLINVLQLKVFICCKTLSNRIRTQMSVFKNQKPKVSYIIARGHIQIGI